MTAPSNVVLAKRGEEKIIFDFFVLAAQDNGFFKIDSSRTIDMIIKATQNINPNMKLD